MVGREAELAELLAGLDEVRAGRGVFFQVVGEPGIGKTRLAQAVTDSAGGGVEVVWGRC